MLDPSIKQAEPPRFEEPDRRGQRHGIIVTFDGMCYPGGTRPQWTQEWGQIATSIGALPVDGYKQPDAPARAYLMVIARDPSAIAALLSEAA
jgi:hypothetical protein